MDFIQPVSIIDIRTSVVEKFTGRNGAANQEQVPVAINIIQATLKALKIALIILERSSAVRLSRKAPLVPASA